ncbi:MAG: cation:proton antiporter [Gemmatimonas sp.]|uniref:cation:proton antiporter domain-containing protein n=1 Tax=Gemmatimonas sp. TaxID=1962908 RepID=UPI00391F44F3
MPESHAFLTNLALVLCVAAVTTFLFQRIRQPVVFGYLVAGMIVGPHVPIPIVVDEGMVKTLSELGVVLLMFGLGLDFSLRKLAQVGPTSGLVALIDSSAMMFFGYLLGRLLGWTTIESVYAGAIVAISSTTIIVKAFSEQEVSGRFTRIVFGILIIEDLIAILLIATLTTISSGGELSAGDLALTAGRLGLFLAGLVGVGLLFVPRLVRAVVRLDRPETTLVVSLGLCFAAAWLAVSFGYSVALGAFIAGSLVAESGEAKVVEHAVAGVRDMFGAIFFVSVGMMIDPRLIAEHWVAVTAFTLVVMAGKLLAVSMGAFVTGYDVRTSVQAGMSLTQIGEFAFIIAAVGLATGATRDFLYPVAVAVSAITTLTTPLFIRASDRVAAFVDRYLPRPLQTFVGLYGSWIEHLRQSPGEPDTRLLVRRQVRWLLLDGGLLALLVIGTAVERAHIARQLIALTGLAESVAAVAVIAGAVAIGIPLVVGIIRVSRALGLLLATRALPRGDERRLDYAAAPRRVLVATLQLAIVALVGLPLVAITEPFLPLGRGPVLLGLVLVWLIVAFWRSTADLHHHTRAGAEIILTALAKQLAPADQPLVNPTALGLVAASGNGLQRVHQLLPGLGDPVAVRVGAGSAAAGRTLGDLQLRAHTGAVVLAITRGDTEVLLPVGTEVLAADDVVALAGTTEAIESARRLLEVGA